MKSLDIIIFGGQSNMQGQSEVLSDTSTVKGAMEYKWCSNQTTPLSNPVGENITVDYKQGEAVTLDANLRTWIDTHITGSACYGYTNLVPKFCEAYITQTNREVMAVHIAKGSTTIAKWIPGTAGFEILVKKSTAAIRKATEEGYEIGNIYFVWLQGESDALEGNATKYYKSQLQILKNALKKSVGIQKFCVIRVGRFAEAINASNAKEKDDAIIIAQEEICEEDTDFVMLTTITEELSKVAEYMNQSVKGHYSAKGLEILGEKAGEALGKLI